MVLVDDNKTLFSSVATSTEDAGEDDSSDGQYHHTDDEYDRQWFQTD